MTKKRIFSCLLLIALPAVLFSLDSRGSITPKGTVELQTAVEMPIYPIQLRPELGASYGIADRVDLTVRAFDFMVYPYFKFQNFWTMVRYGLDANNILALKTGLSGTRFLVSPQYHLVLEFGWFVFRANALCDFKILSDFIMKPALYAAPGFRIGPFELDTEFELAYEMIFKGGKNVNTLSLNPVPEISLDMGNVGKLALSCNLGNILTTYPSYKFLLQYELAIGIGAAK